MSPPPQRIGLPWPELNDGLAYKDAISSSESELTTVSEFYFTKYKSSAPLLGWIQRIQNGQIQIDGEVVKDPNTLLRSGSKLVYSRLPWKEPDTPYSLEVLYEDDDLIALNKPSGLQVLPGGLFQQRTVLTQLQWCFGKNDSYIGSRESPHPVPVHRLGRGTSGILLCAKTKLAKTKLAAYFAEGTSLVGSGNLDQECGTGRKLSKIYRALADGIVEEDEVVIKQPIGVVRYPGVAQGLYVASPEGKPAFSKVFVLERDREKNCSLVKVFFCSILFPNVICHTRFTQKVNEIVKPKRKLATIILFLCKTGRDTIWKTTSNPDSSCIHGTSLGRGPSLCSGRPTKVL
jgi:23S rRNA-/tRNA-specific pseudouridylate synthase